MESPCPTVNKTMGESACVTNILCDVLRCKTCPCKLDQRYGQTRGLNESLSKLTQVAERNAGETDTEKRML